MTVQQWSDLLFWSWVINLGLLLASGVLTLALRDTIYRLHGQLFNLPEESVARSLYLIYGFYKILVTAFMLVPWLALELVL